MSESPDPLERLSRQIRDAKHARQAHENPKSGGAVSHGMRAGIDLVSGVAVGTGLGYVLDRWLETLPWFSLACFALGLAAGVKLMLETSARASRALEEEEQREKQERQERTEKEHNRT